MNVWRIAHACKGKHKRGKKPEFGHTPKVPPSITNETHDSISNQWKCRGIFDLVVVEFFIGSIFFLSGDVETEFGSSKKFRNSLIPFKCECVCYLVSVVWYFDYVLNGSGCGRGLFACAIYF